MQTSTKIIIALVAVIIVGAGWVMIKDTQMPVNQLTDTREASEDVLSASFSCSDNTSFIAEFSTADTVSILVDGEVIRTLSKTAGDGQRYEDNDMVYVFAGEELTITNKSTKKTANCTQPLDTNNAPMNFGDAGEGSGMKADLILIGSENIVGTWQSTTDAKFSREFKANGTVIDYYDGKSVTDGTWQIFTKEKPVVISFPLDTNVPYLQLTEKGSQSDTLDFKITKLTPESLELIYLGRGGALTFTRTK